LFSRK